MLTEKDTSGKHIRKDFETYKLQGTTWEPVVSYSLDEPGSKIPPRSLP